MNVSRRSGVQGNPAPPREERADFPHLGSTEDDGRARGFRGALGLFASLLSVLAGAWTWVVFGDDTVSSPLALAALALAAGGWMWALWLARRVRDSVALGIVIALGALALRLAFLAAEPALSDDVHRYVWEGALVAEGVDPYATPPASDALARFQERWPETFRRVNHPEVSAAYPPLAEIVNAAVVAAAGGADRPERARLFLRLFYTGCDLLACLPLAWLLARAGLPRTLVVAWAWNPWVALESAGSAHLDALAILCLLLALACLSVASARSLRDALALACLAAGGAVKLLPLALVPFALRGARRPVLAACVLAASAAACVLPFVLLTGAAPSLGGLREYAFRWESFSLLHRGIEPLFARLFPYDEGWTDPRRLARALELALWLAVAAFAWRRRFEPWRAAAWLVGACLVLTPTLHPWYLTWIVPFLALAPSRAWTALVAAAPLLYWPVEGWRARGVWEEPAWLFPLVGGAFWALLALDGVRFLRARR